MNRLSPFRFAAAAILAAALPVAAEDADFSHVVALGDSLTAGFASGSLHQDAQDWSYPRIFAMQAATGAPEQPTIKEPGLPPKLELKALVPVTIGPAAGLGVPLNITLQRPYDNLGIPGAKIHDIVATKTACGFNPTDPTCANPFYDLVLRNFTNPAAASTALQQAVVQTPSFLLLWAGNNDVLGAATSGTALDGITLTSAASFEADLRTILQTFHVGSPDTKIVLVNLPDVSTIPFVTTVPAVVVNPATNQPVLDSNGQPIPLIGKKQQSTDPAPLPAGTRVTLGASALLRQGIGIPTALGGTGLPLPDGGIVNGVFMPGVLLYNDELSLITTRTNELNAVIDRVATEYGFPVVDSNGALKDIAAGKFVYGGVPFTSSFLTGGVFSYDGVHPTKLGYAIMTNEIIKVVDDFYEADIPQVNLFPFMFGTAIEDLAPSAVEACVVTQDAIENLRDLFAPTMPEPPARRHAPVPTESAR